MDVIWRNVAMKLTTAKNILIVCLIIAGAISLLQRFGNYMTQMQMENKRLDEWNPQISTEANPGAAERHCIFHSTNDSSTILYNVTATNEDGRRTGNLLFNLAAVAATAHRHKLQAVWVKVKRSYDPTSIFTTSLCAVDRRNETMVDYKTIGDSGAGKYNSKVENLTTAGMTNSNILLSGFFQSWKYFTDYEELLHQQFRFKPHILSKAISFYKYHVNQMAVLFDRDGYTKVTADNTTFIGVHVRRSDITKSHFVNFGYTTPKRSYFKNAVSFFKERTVNPHFIVCSDDYQWSKYNLLGIHPKMTFCTGGADGVVDLAVLSMCEHTIMSTGTYGWWAGWLANGTTIYYKNWPRNGTDLYKLINKEDFFMPHWIPME